MQEQQSCSGKTLQVGIEIVSNGSNKIIFVAPLRKKTFFPFLYHVLVSCFPGWLGKIAW